MTLPLVSTTTAKYALDVNTGTVLVPVWTRVRGIMEFVPPDPEPVLQDDSDYDVVAAGGFGGWKSQAKTALAHTTTFKCKRGFTAGSTTYDPGQEAIRLAGFLLDPSTRVLQFRYYERVTGGPEAYSFFAEITWKKDGGKMEDLATASVTLSGVGALTAITNPNLP
jgi:hypothetical protein